MDNEKREWIVGKGEIEYIGKLGDGLECIQEEVQAIVRGKGVSPAVKKMNLETLRSAKCPWYGSGGSACIGGYSYDTDDWRSKMVDTINQAISSLKEPIENCNTYPQVVKYKQEKYSDMKNPQFCQKFCFNDGSDIDADRLRKEISRLKKSKKLVTGKVSSSKQVNTKIENDKNGAKQKTNVGGRRPLLKKT